MINSVAGTNSIKEGRVPNRDLFNLFANKRSIASMRCTKFDIIMLKLSHSMWRICVQSKSKQAVRYRWLKIVKQRQIQLWPFHDKNLGNLVRSATAYSSKELSNNLPFMKYRVLKKRTNMKTLIFPVLIFPAYIKRQSIFHKI